MDELGFKLVSVAYILGAACLRMYGLFRAGAFRRPLKLQRDLAILRVIRTVLGVPWYAVMAGWLLGWDWALSTLMPFPDAVRWIGVIVGGLAIALMAWSHIELGANYESTIGERDDQRLVTSGPYRWVRHPLNLSFVVMHAGVFLISTSWLVGLTGIGLSLAVLFIRSPAEELRLEARYGDAHRLYAARTGRFLPRP